ncbi:hypothetical protein HMPREF2863_05055 [Micrococcus sp. HMSC067E09]|uniref:site-specific DNA-methyltransferase n=1 Tax=Micrococcus sp. HMSC067E09 TaxID=1739367 RepID=UPI0008A24357|nr:site-specific DNA-methyltransferase [Micrococcus sp. HMSC067E09]OFR91179.1 hypothetical protein HMPREF2863_05055 [Micrococcus sp. HMSC067E09]
MKRKPRGRLELTWMGKDSALIPSENGKYDYAWVDPDDVRVREIKTLEITDQVGKESDNLVIIGDSGDALRSLSTVPEWEAKYGGQVKLVYIDPPFNTEQTFEHYADQLEHSVWLTMMRDRLRDLRPLLAADASVWVHLDDVENHRMRVLMDEEFGAENFIAEVHWQKTYSPRNDAKGLSNAVDVILVYQNGPGWAPNGLPRTAAQDARYSSPDGDPEPWMSSDVSAPGARTHQGMVYAIQHPFTGELLYPASGRHWTWGQEDVLAAMQGWAPYELRNINDAAERAKRCGMAVGDVRPNVPAIMLAVGVDEARKSAERRMKEGNWPAWYITKRGEGGLRRKSWLSEIRSTRTPDNLWLWEEVGHTDGAKKEIQALFPGQTAFSTPKPERLLERVIQIGSNTGDLVLDFFGGSGTTAAVAHKMRRRWITVELLDGTAQTFTIPRLRKVVDGTDTGGVSTKTARIAADMLPEGMTPKDATDFGTALNRTVKVVDFDELDVKLPRTLTKDLDEESLARIKAATVKATLKALKEATKTRKVKTTTWEGGGGFTVAKVGPSMYEVDDDIGAVFLSPEATNGAWSKAVAGQLEYTLTPDHAVFAGVKGRNRLAVIDGVVDVDVVRTVVENLEANERAVIVGKAVLPGAAELLAELSKGSRIKHAPHDLFQKGTVK